MEIVGVESEQGNFGGVLRSLESGKDECFGVIQHEQEGQIVI